MYKSNDDFRNKKALFDTMLNTVTDTIHLVTDKIDKKRSRRYFRIKKGHLYWYTKEESDKAQNSLNIRKIEQIEINQDDEKMILIVSNDKLYKLENKNKAYIQEWFKSICLVRSQSEEYLNLDRYVDSKVFEKVTGKSIYKDFEEILKEQYEEIEKERKQTEEDEKRIRDIEIERELHREHEAKAKKNTKKGKGLENKGVRLFKEDELLKDSNTQEESSGSLDMSPVYRGDSEYKEPTESDFPLELKLEANRSTLIRDNQKENLTNKNEETSLKLFRTNTASELDNFKSKKKIDEKEKLMVLEKHSNVMKDNMFDLIQKYESQSSDEGSSKSSVVKSSKRSAKKKPEEIKAATEASDTEDYSSSSLQKGKKKKSKTIEQRQVEPSSGFFGCFSCFKKKNKS